MKFHIEDLTMKILQKYFARAFSNKKLPSVKNNRAKFKGKFAWMFAKTNFHSFLKVSRFTQTYF